jgi:hypothetical protein
MAYIALGLALVPREGHGLDLSNSVIAGGGGLSTGGNFTLEATVGQAAAVTTTLKGGQFSMQLGFWTPPSAKLVNISTRLPVLGGDNVLIGGFIVTGPQPKKVILRALGPSLPLAGALANPVLELYQGDTLLEFNDNWMDSPNKQAIIDSTVPPTNPLEAAIVRTVTQGGYTAIVRGLNNGTGIGIVEAYDLDQAANSELANISTRGFVQTGDNVLIAGTIIIGQAQRIIIRALGPSLTVPGALADPTLELRNGNGALLDSNDNWKDSTHKQAIIDSTIPPTNDSESAIVATLPGGGLQYTAIVRGANSSTGVAVVEIYVLN